MSNDHKKDFLWGYKRAMHDMKRAEEDLEEYRTRILYPTSLYDDMPRGSGETLDLSKYMPEIERRRQKCLKRWYVAMKKADEIKNCIRRLEKEEERDVLHYRYIMCLGWEEVVEKMNYEERQVYYIHGDALKNLIIPKRVQ